MVNDGLRNCYDLYGACWRLFRSAYDRMPLSADAWQVIIDQGDEIGSTRSEAERDIIRRTWDLIASVDKQRRAEVAHAATDL